MARVYPDFVPALSGPDQLIGERKLRLRVLELFAPSRRVGAAQEERLEHPIARIPREFVTECREEAREQRRARSSGQLVERGLRCRWRALEERQARDHGGRAEAEQLEKAPSGQFSVHAPTLPPLPAVPKPPAPLTPPRTPLPVDQGAPMPRTIVSLLAAFALLCAPAGVAGCAGALPLIHDVATVVADITGALDQAEAAVRAHETVDPALAAKALDAIAKARKLVEVVRASARTAEAASDQQYGAAVAALLEAYQAVLDAARSFGVLAAPAATRGRLGAAPAGVALVPTTDELRKGLGR